MVSCSSAKSRNSINSYSNITFIHSVHRHEVIEVGRHFHNFQITGIFSSSETIDTFAQQLHRKVDNINMQGEDVLSIQNAGNLWVAVDLAGELTARPRHITAPSLRAVSPLGTLG